MMNHHTWNGAGSIERTCGARMMARVSEIVAVARTSFGWVVLILLLLPPAAAQQGYTFDVGGGVGWPVGPTSRYVGPSYNFVAGAGPNLRHHMKALAEFMFQGVPPEKTLLEQDAITDGRGRLYSFTGNILMGMGNARTGAYVIGGGGYYRRTMLAQPTAFREGQSCSPILELWNVQCVNGILPANVTLSSYTSNAAGLNAGAGLTYALGQSPVNLYVEFRYHYAFTSGVHTSVIPVTVGVRF
jgi:hypothetical protein